MNKFERHFESSSSRMFKHQASRFVDDLWIALKFTNKIAREVFTSIRNGSQSSILHDIADADNTR